MQLVHDREAAKATLMERSPWVTAHRKAGTSLQARTMLSSRRSGEGDAVLIEKSADATVGRQHSQVLPCLGCVQVQKKGSVS